MSLTSRSEAMRFRVGPQLCSSEHHDSRLLIRFKNIDDEREDVGQETVEVTPVVSMTIGKIR